jgi:excisionase family DNA binding protein
MGNIGFIKPKEVAELIGCGEKTLTNWRYHGINLPFYKPSGRNILYKESDVREYIESTLHGVK